MKLRTGHICSILLILIWVTTFGGVRDNVPFSYDPPEGLKPDNVPLFILLGWDDCMYPDGMKWVLDTLLNKQNPAGNNNPKTFDGTPLHAAFYINTIYAEDPDAVAMWKKAYEKGHEIANHTNSHTEDLQKNPTKEKWLTEMTTCHDWIVKNMGIAVEDIWGFRTPFLCQTSTSMTAEDQMKFVYDCSITHEPKDYDRIFVWPYTLDKGTAPGSQTGLGNHPGLWELPVYNAALDASGYPHMCGMDFSIWPRMTSKADMVNVLKWSLDMRLAAGKNRAPMTVGMHPDLYSPSNDEQLVNGWIVKLNDRKQSIVDFITYALTKPMVRFVSGKQLIQWMRKPVGLDGTSGVKNAEKNAFFIPQSVRISAGHILNLSLPNKGLWNVELYAVDGTHISTIASGYFSEQTMTISIASSTISAGIYIIRVVGEQGGFEQMVSVWGPGR